MKRYLIPFLGALACSGCEAFWSGMYGDPANPAAPAAAPAIAAGSQAFGPPVATAVGAILAVLFLFRPRSKETTVGSTSGQ